MKSTFLKVVGVVMMLLSVLTLHNFANAADTNQDTTAEGQHKILHTNDMHGRLEQEDGRVIGMAKLKTIKEQENPDLTLDAADAFQGLPLSNESKGEEMAKVMNAVGYDAMTVGNHEFDFGFDQLKKLESMLDFPIVTANVYKDGKPAFKKSTIVEKNGKKYGIVGVTTPQTKTTTSPEGIKGVEFKDPESTVTEEIKRIQDDVDSIIVLSHMGVNPSTKKEWRGDYLTEQLSKNESLKRPITVIDGHSHTVIENGQQYGDSLLAQTGATLQNVGIISYDFKDGKMNNLKSRLIHEEDTKDVKPNEALAAQVEKASKEFDKKTSEVIIENNPVHFDHYNNEGPAQETNLGHAIADAMEQYGQTKFSQPSDFAITNAGGIREEIRTGEVTLKDIITVLPFGNRMAQIDLKGSDVKAAFEHSLGGPVETKDGKKKLAGSGGYLQVSDSIRVHYDLDKPDGERVTSIKVLNKETKKFEALDESRTYHIATNDFTARGGDGYEMFKKSDVEEGLSLEKVFADYLKDTDLSQYQKPEEDRVIYGEAESNEDTGDNTGEQEETNKHPGKHNGNGHGKPGNGEHPSDKAPGKQKHNPGEPGSHGKGHHKELPNAGSINGQAA
ncbi:5'-nucleotidase C-terminal domain-containing protein [Staphylococcus massiliensis]|uniref:5'-nucleotidase n=1 Tax=Staphylococcus massiliensis S46 TaxID=1229783 RepID=K9AQ40_9STAP|nr:5'-nucleotidase C-terminal domain-containing protein [Staphylococcus massiliensis]EKU48141.1 5'-nucleotidase [Staphylococcus massiliensis S46]POA00956.1 bifunctional metallophosphatase/5'-nucleotidase [Staphylococcus massiliensis CCUG 55927]